MKLERKTIAKIHMLGIGFAENQEQQEQMLYCAENKVPCQYGEGAFIFFIAKGDETIPLERFAYKDTKNVIVALSYDAVTLGILPAIWLVEITKPDNCMIEVVGDIGKDAFTGEIRFGLIRFPSIIDLLKVIDINVKTENTSHLQKLQNEYKWTAVPGGVPKLTHAYIRGALRRQLSTHPDAIVSLNMGPSGQELWTRNLKR